MAELWHRWRPVSEGGVEENAEMINEIMMTLSVYGYGALPADPLQSQAKISGFCNVLEECPLWALKEAGKEWRKTQPLAPSPAEFLKLSRDHMGWMEELRYNGKGDWDFMSLGGAYEKIIKWLKS